MQYHGDCCLENPNVDIETLKRKRRENNKGNVDAGIQVTCPHCGKVRRQKCDEKKTF